MAPIFSKLDHTQESGGHEDWTLVRANPNSEERPPQYKDCTVSSSEEGTCTAGNDPSGLTINVNRPQPDEDEDLSYVPPVKIDHSDFGGESTLTGPSSHTLLEDDVTRSSPEPCPLTSASIDNDNILASKKDIAAWIDGKADYWLPADDQASILPLKGTTRHSSDGSFAVIMAPLQPGNVVKEVMGTGCSFDAAVPYNTRLEFDRGPSSPALFSAAHTLPRKP